MSPPRRTIIFLAWLVGLSATGSATPERDFGYPPTSSLDEVRGWVDAASKEHPRLLVTAEDLEGLRGAPSGEGVRAALARAVVSQAEALAKVPPVTRSLQGRRLLGQSRRALKRVLTLATAYHLTGNEAHARRAEAEMLAVAGFSDWNPSHFLDVAEMTLALALGYDWLFPQLDASRRATIRAAIVRKGVALPFETKHKGWVRSTNNWGQVCHGGLTAGALAVMEDEPDLAAHTVHNAIHNVTESMAVYAPHGSYPEGPGYWSYGTTYNVVLIAVLESALGTDFGLSQAPGFDETGQYPALATGPSGLTFNYADGGSTRRVQPVLYWFAHRYGRPDWLLGESQLLEETLAALGPADAGEGGKRFLPFLLLWMDDPDIEEVRLPLHWNGGGEVPVTMHRSSWSDPGATYVGLKGGSPSANHGQMDTGSFVLDADGVRWAVDLGAEGYHGIESRGMNLWGRTQSSDRWTIFRQQNEGHNTLVIDGQPQQVDGHAPVVAFSDDPAFPHSIVDMSEVYAGQAVSVERGVALLPGGAVLVQDELEGLTPGATVRWGMITPGEAGPTGERTLVLSQGDARLALEILSPPSARWTLIDTETPRQEWDSPNPGTRMVAFEASAPPSGELLLATRLTPSGKEAGEPELRPLGEWSDPLPVTEARSGGSVSPSNPGPAEPDPSDHGAGDPR